MARVTVVRFVLLLPEGLQASSDINVIEFCAVRVAVEEANDEPNT